MNLVNHHHNPAHHSANYAAHNPENGFKLLTNQKLKSGFTNKQIGSFKETDKDFQKNIESLALGMPVLLNQTHSDIILEVTEPFSIEALPEGDAMITRQKNLLLMVKVADCQGIIIFDPIKQALGVVHSGWKGSTKNILGKTIRRMKEVYDCDPKSLLVAISPSLGPCCAEFTDPKTELPVFCHPFIQKNNHVDFWALSKKQCQDEGVLESNIEITGICTKDSPDFFSYRLGDEGRMGVYAKLT